MDKKKLLVLLIIVAVSPLVLYSYIAAISVRVAEVGSVTGTVNVQSAETGKWAPAEKGMKLYEGDIVKTGTRSKIVILLDDGSQTQLTSMATLTMQKLRRGLRGQSTELDMEVGKNWTKVKKLDKKHDTFNISTPTAVAGVRGTYFSTEVEQTADSTFDVFEGEVVVSMKSNPNEKVTLLQSQRSKVKKGRAPSAVTPIPAGELQKSLEMGIGGSANSEDASYDMKVVAEPQTLKAGETGMVKVQFIENGKPYNGEVIFSLSLAGSATFVQNGSNSIEINSSEKGYVELEVTAEGDEPIQITADVNFLVEE